MSRYVESDPRARRSFFACVVAVLATGTVLKFYVASLPQPFGTPEVVLQTFAERALLASILATLIYAAFCAFVIWLALRTARSKQWPPIGMRVPFRIKVRSVPNVAGVWVLAGALLSGKVYVVVLYWEHYRLLQSLADVVAK